MTKTTFKILNEHNTFKTSNMRLNDCAYKFDFVIKWLWIKIVIYGTNVFQFPTNSIVRRNKWSFTISIDYFKDKKSDRNVYTILLNLET